MVRVATLRGESFLAMTPLFACGWTYAFLAEPIAPAMLAGGALMLVAALVASTDARTVDGAVAA